MSAPIAFDDVAQALAAGGSTVHAAEAHGCLCGALCARGASTWLAEWLEEIPARRPRARQDVSVTTAGPLKSLFDQSRAVLEAREMEFEPLLPDDEATLDERVEALGAWAQGFLYGFGAAGTVQARHAADGSRRGPRAISPKSRAPAPSAPRASKSKRARYAELVEFVRVGVQLVYDELADAARRPDHLDRASLNPNRSSSRRESDRP